MKKAFEQNVSRAKPRVRLGAMFPEAVEPQPDPALLDPMAAAEAVVHATPSLAEAVRARVQSSQEQRPPAAVALGQALEKNPPVLSAPPTALAASAAVARAATVEALSQTVAAPAAAPLPVEPAPVASAEPLPELREVAQPKDLPLFSDAPELDPAARRERLKERLKAVRENPRPQPLPATVAETGVLAVERISALQHEVGKLQALNLALTQDLESARRQAERATAEAKSRMDEATRLSGEMEGRAKLLAELEGELSNLESERDESLLRLQESRQALEAAGHKRTELEGEISKRDTQLAECLAEEERIASELEEAQDTVLSLKKEVTALCTERDTLARQVTDLTGERAELLEARKALESVHRALAQAVMR